MMESGWGLLGPETIGSTRRTRTLGLGRSVRLFNNLAVPGMGGVWFGKQLLLATLGVSVAEKARAAGAKVRNIETANAIEALACWLSFTGNDWKSDDRLRGKTKLQRLKDTKDYSFKRFRQRKFYVTQPMRMACVETLPSLGFVDTDGTRFSGFRVSRAGQEFLEAAFKDFTPYHRNVNVIDHLVKWVRGEDAPINSNELRDALSPIVTLQERTRKILKERLLQGNQRRENSLSWMETIRTTPGTKPDWEKKPLNIQDDVHWDDLKAGALFFKTRDVAVEVLDALETHIGNKGEGCRFSLKDQVPKSVGDAVIELQKAAEAFLDVKRKDEDANRFCRDCVIPDNQKVLQTLVERDGRVLRLAGQYVLPGPAFRGALLVESEDDDGNGSPEAASTIPLPDGISYRMRNLYLLNLDLHDRLDTWLNANANTGENQ
ncbi:MAG: hypothetical protein ACP5IL_07540 [Syntrophobacteraceae bacterium]